MTAALAEFEALELHVHHQAGVDADGAVQGHFRATALPSRFCERLVAAGVPPRDVVFEPGTV